MICIVWSDSVSHPHQVVVVTHAYGDRTGVRHLSSFLKVHVGLTITAFHLTQMSALRKCWRIAGLGCV